MSDPTKLTHKQEVAIGFLLMERTQEKAAERAGVSSATLRRWFRLPAFVNAYRLARRDAIEGAFGQMQRATTAAVAALRRNLRCGNPSVEVRAAATILEQSFKGLEFMDLVEYLEEVREKIAQLEKHR